DLAEHKFDLKHLLRTILQSRTYQLDGHAGPGNEADATNTYFTRYQVKRLGAEQLADAVDFATGTRQKYTGLPPGTRAIQLPDPPRPDEIAQTEAWFKDAPTKEVAQDLLWTLLNSREFLFNH